MNKVLILGSTGMLGTVVSDYFRNHTKYNVSVTARKSSSDIVAFDAHAFNKNPDTFSQIKDYDYLINCIGIIKPYCKDNDPEGVYNAIQVNAIFPHNLARFLHESKTKVIQIATDCVYSGAKGKYVETDLHDALDVYGKSKSLGEVFFGNYLNIRCSIIGPEAKAKVSLLEWYLSQKDGEELNGFEHHAWNGVTTLQYAQLCDEIIAKDMFDDLVGTGHTLHYTPNTTVTKYQLLHLFNEVFKKQHPVKNVNDVGPPVDRTLSSNYSVLSSLSAVKSMKEALMELHVYMNEMNV